jgi:hypothetical protein
MGRNKIPIERIQNPRNRQATFTKRKNGLFKKAIELSILCDAEIALIIVNPNNKIYQYSTTDMGELLTKYQNRAEAPHLTLNNGDYPKLAKKESLETVAAGKRGRDYDHHDNHKVARQRTEDGGRDLKYINHDDSDDADFQPEPTTPSPPIQRFRDSPSERDKSIESPPHQSPAFHESGPRFGNSKNTNQQHSNEPRDTVYPQPTQQQQARPQPSFFKSEPQPTYFKSDQPQRSYSGEVYARPSFVRNEDYQALSRSYDCYDEYPHQGEPPVYQSRNSQTYTSGYFGSQFSGSGQPQIIQRERVTFLVPDGAQFVRPQPSGQQQQPSQHPQVNEAFSSGFGFRSSLPPQVPLETPDLRTSTQFPASGSYSSNQSSRMVFDEQPTKQVYSSMKYTSEGSASSMLDDIFPLGSDDALFDDSRRRSPGWADN